MQLMMVIYEDAAALARREGPDAPAYWGMWQAYAESLRAAGVVVGGNGLQPPATATTLRIRDGARQVQDGPFADTKEMLGGYFIIEVPTLEVGLDWAARCPAASYGAVELRPVLPPPA